MDDKTIYLLKKALDAQPDDWETRRHLAELLAEAGETGEARRLIMEATSIPDTAEDRAFVDQLLGTGETPASESVSAEEAPAPEPPSASQPRGETIPSLDAGVPQTDSPAMAPSTGVANLVRSHHPPASTAASPVKTPPAGTLRPAPVKRYARRKPVKRSKKVAAGTADVADKRGKKASHFTSFAVAGLFHGLLVLLFIIWVLTPGPIPEPSVIMQAPPLEDAKPDPTKRTLLHSLKPDPSSSSSARAQVIAAAVTSPIAVPEVEVTQITEDVIGAGDTFGTGSGWGMGEGAGGGGTVRFFGQEQKAKRVCYVVDFSGSMQSNTLTGSTRIDVLKAELIRSIKSLDPAVKFTVMFFSGGAWTLEEGPTHPDYIARVGDPESKTRAKWRDASAKNKSEVVEIIEKMPLAPNQGPGAGTLWLPPLKATMGIHPDPDVIFLLTDGDAGDSNDTIRSINDVVPSNIPVNTVALELPGTTAGYLLEIAKKTGGTFSLHLDGNEYVGNRAEKYTDPKYDPPQ